MRETFPGNLLEIEPIVPHPIELSLFDQHPHSKG